MTLKELIAQYTGSDAEIAEILNTPSIEVPLPCFVSYRTLLGMFGVARVEAVRVAIKTLSPTVDNLMMIPDSGGIDVSNVFTRGTLSAMTPGVLTAAECAAVLALGVRLVSPLEANGLPAYHAGDIAEART